MKKEYPGTYAIDFRSMNAVTIEQGKHYNGSEESAFGGATSWPHLTVGVSFRVGEEGKMADIAEKIEKLLREECVIGYTC